MTAEPEVIDDTVADMESRGVRDGDTIVGVGLTTAVADSVEDNDTNADLESLAVMVEDAPSDKDTLDVDEIDGENRGVEETKGDDEVQKDA